MHRPLAVLTALASAVLLAPGATAAPTDPTDPAYTARDTRNIADAYGRITGPGGQLQNPAYLPALVTESTATGVEQLLQQAASPARPAVTPGNVVPGWNVGNPLRAGWERTRGRMTKVAFTNQHGALLRGRVFTPRPGARDPYTGAVLRAPFPGVVLTEGSVQGSSAMYEWLAQDLAERGYVVLTYDVQGQGESETFPHDGPLPTCCAGVPSQQEANFVVGTRNALSFFTSTPARPYRNPGADGAAVTRFNPAWRLFDRSPDRRTATPGRTSRIAVIGHSLGAFAISGVQAVDKRIATVVALDKLQQGSKPVVPALAVQSEYGFTVSPWWLSGGSSLAPAPSPEGPDPRRERASGYDAWQRAGVDSMLVVPRASTHLDYTDIPLVLPASRWGQALTSVYVQRWLGHYLRHDTPENALLARSFRYLEPVGGGAWKPVTLERDRLLSFYYCSAYALGSARDGDVTDVGC